MKIAIDMDNTIIDEFGSTLRPGIIEILKELSSKHDLILWTNSKRTRTIEILDHFELRKYFSKIITRENYDPDEIGLRKDILKYGFDVLIDDDPEEIKFNENKGKAAFLIPPYRKNEKVNFSELIWVLAQILNYSAN